MCLGMPTILSVCFVVPEPHVLQSECGIRPTFRFLSLPPWLAVTVHVVRCKMLLLHSMSNGDEGTTAATHPTGLEMTVLQR